MKTFNRHRGWEIVVASIVPPKPPMLHTSVRFEYYNKGALVREYTKGLNTPTYWERKLKLAGFKVFDVDGTCNHCEGNTKPMRIVGKYLYCANCKTDENVPPEGPGVNFESRL